MRSFTSLCAALAVLSGVSAQTVFNLTSTTIINAPIDVVWNVVTNFSAFPEWNSFTRSQVITNELLIPLADQTPKLGDKMLLSVCIPSCPSLPIAGNQFSIEQISRLDNATHTIAWKQQLAPSILLDVERVQVLTALSNGSTKHEGYQPYGGPLATVVGPILGTSLQNSTDAYASDLKARSEKLAFKSR